MNTRRQNTQARNRRKRFLKSFVGVIVAIPVVFTGLVTSASTVSTVTVTNQLTGTAATSMAAGTDLDVVASGNVSVLGTVQQEVSAQWSAQSLQLSSFDSVITPEGWDLEYSTNGTTWTTTRPSLSDLKGLKSVGPVTTLGTNTYRATSQPIEQIASSTFSATGSGDGYDVEIAPPYTLASVNYPKRIFNTYHHTDLTVACHLADGTNCKTGITPTVFSSNLYETNNASHQFWDATNKRLLVPVRKKTDGHMGVACLNVSDINAVSFCSTPFVDLNGSAVSAAAYMSNASRAGDYIWALDSQNSKLLCMRISSLSACSAVNGNVVNQLQLPTVGLEGSQSAGRVTASGSKVYYSTKTQLGCFDAATGLYCNGTTTDSAVTFASKYNYPPFPALSTSGVLRGYCSYEAQACISPLGATVSMPAGLAAFAAAKPLPTWNTKENAGQWAVVGTKFYFNYSPTAPVDNSPKIYCWNFATDASCANFSNNNLVDRIYSITADPTNTKCIWINGDTGAITPVDAVTGLAGCGAGEMATMDYSAIAPRYSCLESRRIITWGTITFSGQSTTVSTVRVTLLDEAGDVITSNENNVLKTWSNQPLVNGVLDMSSLGVADTGTRPSIQITSSDNTVTGSMLAALTASVTYVGDAPQLCFTLEAATTCPNLQLQQGDTSVPDGIIEVSTATTPNGGTATRASLRKVIDGTNTATVCAATTATYTSIPGGIPASSSPGVAPVIESAPSSSPGVAPAIESAPKASVKRPPVYKYISGFADGSPVLTSKIKNSIQAFLKKHNDYSKIQVVGYTEGPTVLKRDKWLSNTRAKNAISFVEKKLKASFVSVRVGASQTTKHSSLMRRIKITLTD